MSTTQSAMTIRHPARDCWRRLTLLALVVGGLSPSGGAGSTRPNFVIIFTDDLGYADVGCFGGKGIRTPNLDKLAREGMRFTSFYVAQAVCSASRAALMTGCYPNRIGILDWRSSISRRTSAKRLTSRRNILMFFNALKPWPSTAGMTWATPSSRRRGKTRASLVVCPMRFGEPIALAQRRVDGPLESQVSRRPM